MSEHGSGEVVRRFWEVMASNDFGAVTDLLAADFELAYPQSGEHFDAAGMVALNTDYPTAGRWTFDVLDLVAADATVVTRVLVRNETVEATAITFFTVVDGAITRMVEYWPDPFDPPSWRTPTS